MGLLVLLGIAVLIFGGFILLWVLADSDDGPGRGP